MGVLAELSKTAGDDEVLVDGEGGKLTKSQIASYYMHPKIRGKVIPQLTGRPALLRGHKAEDRMVEEGAAGPDNPADYVNWVNQRTLEFHGAHGEDLEDLVVEVDPSGNVPPEKTKEIAKMVATVLRGESDVRGVRHVYNGGKGFFVKAKLDQPMKTEKARSRLQKLLAQIPEHVPMATLGMPGPSQVRLDITSLRQGGSHRAEYSINSKTGRVAVPVSSIDSFDPKSATLQAVLGE